MSEVMEHVQHLAQNIGPRPAGTEEERAAAEYIHEQVELGSGLDVQIEDFEAPLGSDVTRLVYAVLAVIAGVAGLLAPLTRIVAVVILLIVSALMVAEYLGKPVVERILPKGACQNVVAKYESGAQGGRGRRSRKVILVAHYDSGKVRADVNGPLRNAIRILRRLSFFAVPALFVLMLIRTVLLGSDTGAASSVFNFLIVVAIILSAVSLVAVIMRRTAKFNDAANANAAGTAALIEIANRIGRGRLTEEEIAHLQKYADQEDEDATAAQYVEQAPVFFHGEEAAREVLPDGVELSYEAQANTYGDAAALEDPDGLNAAKLAIGALTGAAVTAGAAAAVAEQADPSDQAVSAAPVEADQAIASNAVLAEATQDEQPAAAASVPSWYLAAQKKAKRTEDPVEVSSYRSKYTVAMDAAEAARASATAEQVVLEQNDDAKEQDAVAVEPDNALPTSPAPAEEDAQACAVNTDDLIAGEGPNLHFNRPDAKASDEPASDQCESAEEKEDFEAAPRTENRITVSAEMTDEEPAEAEEPVEAEEPAGVDDFVGTVTSQMTSSFETVEDLTLSKKLPKISTGLTGSMTAVGATAQRAPLADTDAKETAKSLLSMLPSIDLNDPAASSGDGAQAPADPHLSAALPKVAQKPSSDVGVAGATGMFAPVTDEMVQNADSEEDLFLDDVEEVDDSGFQENFTDSGAYAGPDYVEMPKSRMRDFFGKVFSRNKNEDEVYSAQPWNDDDVNQALAEQGAQSYTDDYGNGFVDEFNEPYDSNVQYDDNYDAAFDFADAQDDRYRDGDQRYNGGAFSALKDKATELGGTVRSRVRVSANGSGADQPYGDAEDASYDEPYNDQDDGEYAEEQPRRARRGSRRGDAGSAAPRRKRFSESLPTEPRPVETVLPQEAGEIDSFRNPFINSDVWFVALGGELAGNAGMKAFLEAHKDELRGAMIVELDALGAGSLSSVEEEGALKSVKFSSRAKRLARKATQATGIKCGSVSYPWCDSAAACATKRGLPAMHLVGDQGGKPAYFSEPGDVLEVVDENTLIDNTEFVMELIRSVSR